MHISGQLELVLDPWCQKALNARFSCIYSYQRLQVQADRFSSRREREEEPFDHLLDEDSLRPTSDRPALRDAASTLPRLFISPVPLTFFAKASIVNSELHSPLAGSDSILRNWQFPSASSAVRVCPAEGQTARNQQVWDISPKRKPIILLGVSTLVQIPSRAASSVDGGGSTAHKSGHLLNQHRSSIAWSIARGKAL